TRPAQPCRVPPVGRQGLPPPQSPTRRCSLSPLTTPENPTGPQTDSARRSRGSTPVIRGPSPDGPRGRRDRRPTAAPSHTESHRRGPRPSPTSHGSARERRRRHPPPARRRQTARPAGTLPHHVGRLVLKASRPPRRSPHPLP